MTQRVYSHFQRSVEAKMQVGESVAPQIEYAAEVIVHALLEDSRILLCGNGTSAALAQIFAGNLLDRFEKERPGLPAIWLGGAFTTGAGPVASSDVFAKPLRALAQPGDILVTICAGDISADIGHAIDAALERELVVIALTGPNNIQSPNFPVPDIIHIEADVDSICRIHEIHLLVLYCLCDLIDHKLFGIE